jgi:signal transduction histidine kinase/HD-like signal output (HDOD) protein
MVTQSTFSMAVDLARLPSMPHVLLELIEACNSEEVNFEQLSSIIRKDVALSAKVIAAANLQGVHKKRGETAELSQLLVALGLKTVKTITMTSAIQHFFSSFSKQYSAYLDIFWMRSLHCAHLARALALLSDYPSPDGAYLAGLLHRLGQLVMLHTSPDDYLSALVGDGDITDELNRFNATSGEVGAWVLEQWQVKSLLVDAIRYQDEPSDSMGDAPQLVKILHVARRLVAPEAFAADEPIRDAYSYFNLDRERLEAMTAKLASEMTELGHGLGLTSRQNGVEEEDAKARLTLARYVRDFALLCTASQPVGGGECAKKLIADILVDLGILFGLRRTLFLSYDEESNRLRLQENDAAASDLSAFSLSVERGRSLAADALLQGRVKFTDSDKGLMSYQVIDRELAGCLGGDGLVAIPLMRSGLRIGVVIAAVDAQRRAQLQSQAEFIGLFARTSCERLLQRHENELAQRQSLEEFRLQVQEQASKLSHEANNPLAIINNYIYLLGEKLGQEHPAQEEIGVIKEEIERVGEIVQRLRDPTSDITSEGDAVNINQLVESLVNVFRASLSESRRIDCEVSLDKRIPPIHIDRNRLKQVLTNLLKNAVEAIGEGGNIDVITRDDINVNGREYVEVTIADDGPGLPDAIKANLFRPLKWAKSANNSGLGLVIVKNLMDELGGSVTCRSEKEEGTRFSILLPRAC